MHDRNVQTANGEAGDHRQTGQRGENVRVPGSRRLESGVNAVGAFDELRAKLLGENARLLPVLRSDDPARGHPLQKRNRPLAHALELAPQDAQFAAAKALLDANGEAGPRLIEVKLY